MMGVNKVILVGRVGREPETKVTKHGTSMASFSLATKSKYKDKSGETVNLTEWHNVQAYGKLANVIKKYVGKGSSLYIEGKLQTFKYEKDGSTLYSTKVVMTSMQFIKTVDPTENSEESYMGPEYEEDYMMDEEGPF
jgi:single-strand DNA-binding protein